MSTFATLKSNIADDLARSDLTTQIGARVLKAIEYYANKDFWFNRGTNTVSTVAGTETYSLPADLITPLRARISDGTITEQLTRVSNEWLDIHFETADQAIPSWWSIDRELLRLRPIPDAVYTVTLTYRKELTALSADSDTNAWTTDAEDLIQRRAEWDIYAHIIRDQQMAQVSKASELEALRCLQERTTKMVSAGRLNTEIGTAAPFNINYG